MDNTDLIQVWKELRSIRKATFQIAMYVEGLKRTCDERLTLGSFPTFRDRRIALEQEAVKIYSQAHADQIARIDDIIRRLESA